MQSLTLTGTAQERGRVHGETYREKIREMAAIRRDLFETYFKGFAPKVVDRLIKNQIKKFSAHRELYAEFTAISEASGVTEKDLLILNNYTDMRDFSFQKKKSSVNLQDGGCSVFSVRGEVDGKARVIAGQTWDMDASAAPFLLHLSIEPLHQKEAHVEVLTVMGCLGLCGVNEHGVAVLINNLHCSETSQGLVWPALVRTMLNQKTAKLAHQAMKKNPPSSGHNYLVVDPTESINLETTGKKIVATHDKPSGALFHTNHYLSKLAKVQIRERLSNTTHARYQALQEAFRNFDFSRFDYKTVAEQIFCGKAGETLSIPIPADLGKAPAAVTCGGILVDLNARKGEVFAGVYADGDRKSIKF